jgi:hypothetical protein
MSLDFQQIREQVRQLGEGAPAREHALAELRQLARRLLETHAHDLEALRQRVALIVQSHDPSLRCALPVREDLNAHFSLPPLPSQATVLAADGSQITPDRQAEVDYGLINVGAIRMCYGSAAPPTTSISSRLYYGEELYTSTGTLTDATLALRRDLNERTTLADLAAQGAAPAVTFTDGPMELWGAVESTRQEASEFQKSLSEYLQTLSRLQALGAITAGYVDKPAASPVVRLLEANLIPLTELPEIHQLRPLRGVSDLDLYHPLLQEGERSPLFALQSQAVKNYTGSLALHFFYLNVGRAGHPWLARVEVPAWVADNPTMLNDLHAVLIDQCRTMGARPYPYLLHRAHETALVSLPEKEQVTQMIALELRRRGVPVGEQSYKQSAKELQGRTSYNA